MREKRGMTVFENGVLKRIFGPKRDKVAGEWRKLHDEAFIQYSCTAHTILFG
jgi:hypothetical protein